TEQSKVPGIYVLDDFTRDPANKGDAFTASPLKQVLETLSKRPDIYVEDVNLCVRPMFFDEKGVLDCIHAANVAAVGVATLAPRAYALEKGHLLGPLTVRGRINSPDDGPPALMRRSNSRVVITLGNLPYPSSVRDVGSYTSTPVATTMVPTSTSSTWSLSAKSIHL